MMKHIDCSKILRVVAVSLVAIMLLGMIPMNMAATKKLSEEEENSMILMFSVLFLHLGNEDSATGFDNFDIKTAKDADLINMSLPLLLYNGMYDIFPAKKSMTPKSDFSEEYDTDVWYFSKAQLERMSSILFGKKPSKHGGKGSIALEKNGTYAVYPEGAELSDFYFEENTPKIISCVESKNGDLTLTVSAMGYDSKWNGIPVTAKVVLRPAKNDWGYNVRSIQFSQRTN